MQMIIRRFALVMVLLAISAACHGQTAPESNSQADHPAGASAQDQSMLIGAGDVVNISVSNSSDFTMKVRVDAKGDVVLPYLGQQHFGGCTVEQIEELLTRLLKEQQYFTDPQVLVFVEQFTSQTISVLGEVNKPGAFPGLGDHTLYEMLSAAGGLTQFASQTALIYRRSQEEPLRISIKPALDMADASATFPVYAGDRIVVPKTGLVYVVGAVKTPNVFPLPSNSNLTLVRALTLAGGPLRTAKRGQIHLVRTMNDSRVDIPVDMGKVLAGKTADMQVKPDDIIYVPDSYAKIIAAGSASVIGSAINAAAYLQR
jgi:polysaccharide export outer membrane protein